MRYSEFVETVVGFSAWDEHLLPSPTHILSELLLLPLLLSSPGAVIGKRSGMSAYETLEQLQKEIEMRLSFDWVLPTKPIARKVAIVGGRALGDEESGLYSSQSFFEAAQALGMSIIVFENEGHWLQSDKYGYLREEFVPLDMYNLAELPRLMADVIENRGDIDGIATFTDQYVEATAQAAEIMNLPTDPSWAMIQAHRKHEMRMLVHNNNIQAIHIDNTEQLEHPDRAQELEALRFPLVVKPGRSLGSRGVQKVTNKADLHHAVRVVQDSGLAAQGILIETYVDGPELDANFALWEGEVAFVEVTDNFPCRGDGVAGGSNEFGPATNFAETVLVSNTGLPAAEVDVIRKSLHESLLKLGFRSGVFHVEARMQNSSVRYRDARGDGILDLVACDDGGVATGQQPDVFLIEVNARTPGTGGTWSTIFTYGVDLGALLLLRAVNDAERFAALSQPFAYPRSHGGSGGGAQFWSAHCMIPIHRDNIRVPHRFFDKVYRAAPEIMSSVMRAEMYAEPGTVVSPTGGIGWIGYVLVYSRASRRHVLEMYKRITEVSIRVLEDVTEFSSD
ncbi:glutathione synthetase ATP-binding domain-like protein [Xylaria bambusicola]|uniref:glutathione synthetase ATP-binding domain-like protein n=1 Tax=Xylaria bambusicola TaxID=326684 RepID=UPI00200830DE|nr:glutathione synthetase ATP-binding domain-like protein [Xylaria bambusicola]KAI0505433.1 glutathione synthetase ATP-binding domain-like protein [Xylaria bambusicola]